MKRETRETVVRYAVLAAASFVCALTYRTFVDWGGLYPGGATGLSILIQRLAQRACDLAGMDFKVPFTPISFILNSIPAYIGFKYIGKGFTMRSVAVIVMTSIFTDLMPVGFIESMISAADLARVKSDPFLTSLFGGIMFGFGMSLCLRFQTSTGGTDFIAIYLSEKKGRETWNFILALNASIILCGAFEFGWSGALYSIIYQFIHTQVVHLMYRAYQHQTLMIVTSRPSKVCEAIYRLCHHGATVIEARGGYSGEKKGIVYSVVSADDTARIYALCKTIDKDAFIGAMSTSRVMGRFYLRPRD